MFRIIRTIKLAILWLILVVGGIFILGFYIKLEISTELGYRRVYGPEWKAVYERYHGSLAHAHAQLAVAVLSLLAVFAILAWAFVQARKKSTQRTIQHHHSSGAHRFYGLGFNKAVFAGALFFLVGVWCLGGFAWKETSRELSYKRQYGAEWRTEYEQVYGSLEHAHMRLAIAVLSLLAVFAILLWTYIKMRNKGKRHRRGHST